MGSSIETQGDARQRWFGRHWTQSVHPARALARARGQMSVSARPPINAVIARVKAAKALNSSLPSIALATPL